MGADAMLRILDPRWGLNIKASLGEFEKFRTKFYVNGRVVDGTFITFYDIIDKLPDNLFRYSYLIMELQVRWDLSSTELRNKIK